MGTLAGRDAGERVAEHAADGDGGVGEAGRRREPVRGDDVAADRERRGVGTPGTDDAEDHEHEPERGDGLAQPQRARRAGVRRHVDRREVEHHVRDHRPDACAGDLHHDVHARVARRRPAEDAVGQRDHRVEVRAGHRPEGEDQGHQSGTGGDRVLEQLEPDVAGGEALRGDAGAHDDRDEQRGADELRRRAPTRDLGHTVELVSSSARPTRAASAQHSRVAGRRVPSASASASTV